MKIIIFSKLDSNPGWVVHISRCIDVYAVTWRAWAVTSSSCGIPRKVMDILAVMQCQKLGKPTWTVFSTDGGLGVKLFWRNGDRSTCTPINANQREKPKLRKKRDQWRLEEFNRKKRQEHAPNVEGVMQPVTEPGKPASGSLGIPASMRCDNDWSSRGDIRRWGEHSDWFGLYTSWWTRRPNLSRAICSTTTRQ